MQGAIDTETGALILIVDAQGLQELVKLLRHPASIELPLQPAPGHSATRAARTLRIALNTDDDVVVKTGDDWASVVGGPTGFARLAHEMELFADHNDLSAPGMHVHFEPGGSSMSDAGTVLAPDSCPMVVAGPVPDEPLQAS